MQWDQIIRKQVVTRLDSIMYGVLGAYLSYYKSDFWYKNRLNALCAGVFIFLINSLLEYFFILHEGPINRDYSIYFDVFYFSITSLSVLFMLPYLSNIKEGKYKFILYISTISY